MTDFLDRVVARVLPVPGGGRVVQTRPRSRFEEPSLGGMGEGRLEEEAIPVEADHPMGRQPPRPGNGAGAHTGAGTQGRTVGSGVVVSPADPVLDIRGAPDGAVGRRGTAAAVPPEPPGHVLPASVRSGRRATGLRRPSGDEGRPGVAGQSAAQGPSSPPPSAPASRGPDLLPVPSLPAGRPVGEDVEIHPGRGSLGAEVPRLQLGPQPRPAVGEDGTPGAGNAQDGAARKAEPPGPGPRRETVLRLPGGHASPPPVDPTPPPIQLRIGRLEIRGSAPAPTPRRTPVAPPQPRPPALDLAEYLRRRSTGRQP